MAQFLNQYNIRKELVNLFRTAEHYIIVVSPFIQLNNEMRSALSHKKNDPKFEVMLLFGKNEFNLSKSLSKEDMDFFSDFSNIRIYYHPDLHAKYYANDSKSIITSLNLHQYSLKNNIEIGILMEHSLFDLTKESRLDKEIFDFMNETMENADLIFEQRTTQESFFFGLFKGEKKREVVQDKTHFIYQEASGFDKWEFKTGFCIRTGVSIPFNLEKPLSAKSFQSWNQYSNPNYPEKFCHYSGEPTDGSINFNKPVLKKHWSQAKALQDLLHKK